MLTMKRGQKFLAVAIFNSGAAFIMSMMNVTMCTLALVFRMDCSSGDLTSTSGSNFMTVLVYNQYIQDDLCESHLKFPGLTDAHTILIMTAILLAFSIANVVSAMALLIAAYRRFNCPYYVVVAAYLHVGTSVAVVIVEVTLGIHFGMDFSSMTRKMDEFQAGVDSNYTFDTMRRGTFFLMCLILKGFVAPAGNLILLPLLLYLVHEDTDRHLRENSPEHSIHSRGVINAFDQSKNEDQWQFQPEWSSRFVPGPSLNPAFVHDNGQQRSPWESHPASHFSSSQASPYRMETRGPASAPGRPFTYLAERSPPPSSTTHPADRARVQDPSLPVPIPAPDYSPKQKLRSVLKPPYA